MIKFQAKLMVLVDADGLPAEVSMTINVVNPTLDLAKRLEQYLNDKVIDVTIDDEEEF